MVGAAGGEDDKSQCCPLVVTQEHHHSVGFMHTIFIVCDGDGDDVAHAHHGAAPVVAQRRPKMHLELLLRLEHRVVVDVDRAVLHLDTRKYILMSK